MLAPGGEDPQPTNGDHCTQKHNLAFLVMRITVFHEAVGDVVDLEELPIILLLHLLVDSPGRVKTES